MSSQKRLLPAVNLRFKFIIIIGCYIFGVLSMTMIAQKDLLTARGKHQLLELAYRLDTIILEIRRYEKNYLLYNTEDALKNNQEQVDLALETSDKIDMQTQKFEVQPLLKKLSRSLHSYQTKMDQLTTQQKENNEETVAILAEGLRMQGQELNELSEELVSFEHKKISSILEELTVQLALWSTTAIMVGIFIPLIMFFKIYKPITIIKKATEDIAEGHFSQIEVIDTRDEMQQVIEAFNTMVSELQRRQDQLVQSQKLSSIGTLSAGIAHQLNNPLNNISTSCQIAISDFDSGDRDFIKQMLNNIDQETARARDVVQGLLEFSREKEFALSLANLKDTVNRAIRLVRSQVPAPIKIHVDIPSDLSLPMDTQRIQEVFLNLIINASQSITGSGIISISASLHKESNQIHIEIHDSGAGIPKEIQGQLFDPFFSTKEEGQGTGLGLSIAYGIIQKHNGEISVESDLGSGTTFLIQLPLQCDLEYGKA
jgi:two-component system, NtrC family, sensor kinase